MSNHTDIALQTRAFAEEESHELSSLPSILQRIYRNRGITQLFELDRDLAKLLPYQSLNNIEIAAAHLADAIMQHQSILIVGDFDADGATSTAVAMRALKSFGATRIDFLVPNRFEFGYGLTKELVDYATKQTPPDWIITVDNGIANHAGVEAAKAKGIRVLITDHHLPAETLPPADVIVNPNQKGDPFPSKNLAGVGVIFYVMLALRQTLQERDWFTQKHIPKPNMARLLDLVALGTIADVVPLDRNNRILVHQGLLRIRSGQCAPGIVGLLETAKRDFTKTVAADLGFAVGARLNAAGRLEDMALGIQCLLSDDASSARALAIKLNQLNDERRGIEQEMQQQALAILQDTKTLYVSQKQHGIALFNPLWHQGVIGIVASRIKERFHRPTIVFAKGQANEIKGSARSIQGFHIRDALAHIDAKHPGLILKFGGHAMAAGLSLYESRFNEFSNCFLQYCREHLTEDVLQHVLWTDGALNQEELTLETALLIRDAGPFGQAFPEPLFDDIFEVIDQRLINNKHLKVQLRKNDVLYSAIAFFVDNTVWPNHRAKKIHIAYRLDINEYRDMRNVQLLIEYLQPIYQ